MEYTVLYDVGRHLITLDMVLFAAIWGALLFQFIKQIKQHKEQNTKIMSWNTTLLAVLLMIWFFAIAIIVSQQWRCYLWVEQGDYQVVEGTVENFDPMPYGGHALESFDIDGVGFSYSDYEPAGGFNKSKSHGGPVDVGKFLKISYHGNHILKIETRENN